MRFVQQPMSTSPEVNPRVAGEAGPSSNGWSAEAEERPRRLAEFGLAIVLGFVGGVVALAAFAWLAEEVLGRQTQQLDDATLAVLRHFSSPTLDRVALGASLLGSEFVIAAGVVLLAFFAWQRRWRAGVGLVLVTGGAQLLNDVLKELFQRTRPAPELGGLIQSQQFSFPSGHAMVSAAFYFFLAYLAWELVRGAWRIVLVGGLALLVLLIGLARLYLAAHFLSDVIAGYFAGFVWTDAVVLGSGLLRIRQRRRSALST